MPMSKIEHYVFYRTKMSKTKHLNISYFINLNERCVFLKEYHSKQNIDAPFEKYLKTTCICYVVFSFMIIMQKELSEWIDVRNLKIETKVVNEINKPVTEE